MKKEIILIIEEEILLFEDRANTWPFVENELYRKATDTIKQHPAKWLKRSKELKGKVQRRKEAYQIKRRKLKELLQIEVQGMQQQ